MGMGTLDAYTADLETQFVENTRGYYAKKRDSWIVGDATPEYLIKTEAALEEEKNRVGKYLSPASEPKLLRVIEEELLEQVEMVLLEKENSGCKVLLANDKSEDLARMFRLFSRLDKGLPPIATIVQDFITEVGLECVNKKLMPETKIKTTIRNSLKVYVIFMTSTLASSRQTLVDMHCSRRH
jgi:cullin 1